MSERGEKKFKRYAAVKGRCRFCRAKIGYIDWKDSQTLSKLSTGQGKMFSRKRSGNCARHQRQFKNAVKYARFMALMPYVAR
jgi:small subunit ribosomal protein S18